LRPQIKKIDPVEPEPEIIREAATIIKQGGVIAFPTCCLYGLGADAFNPDAIERMIKIKQRPDDKPILVLIDTRNRLESLVTNIPPSAEALMEAFWPGRVTLVFGAQEALSGELTAQTGKIGVRLPAHPAACALVKHVRGPVTGTSANLSGRSSCHRAQDLDLQLAGQLDLILDAGTLRGGTGSTVVDVTVDPPRILREGQVTANDILSRITGV
jgi:L-threonylcarbamoyladenylate synthase